MDSEEEHKHSIQHPGALNGHRKRSRSQDDEGAAAKKLTKLELEPPNPNGVGNQEAEARGDDDPLISGVYHQFNLMSVTTHHFPSVNGVQKPFSEVTEEDQELMTPDEYTAYFEVFQARS